MAYRSPDARVRAFSKRAVMTGMAAIAAPSLAFAAAAADKGDPSEVEGVVVTTTRNLHSTKFTAPVLDTPKSIAVIPRAVIEQTGATTLVDALRTVPGITMGTGEGGNAFGDRPFIRGFDSTSGLLVDGVRDTGSGTREVFDVQAIEVLKGPSGAFAGRGSSGGSINLVNKTAQASDFAVVEGQVGTADQKRVTADVNRKLNDQVAVRLNGMWQDSDIPGRDAVYDKRWGFAPTVTFGLDGPNKAVISYYHYQSKGLADYGHPLDLVTGEPVHVPRHLYYGLKDRDFIRNNVDTGTVDLSHDFGGGLVLRNLTRYADSTNNYIASNPDDSSGNVATGQLYRSPKTRDSHDKSWANQTDLSGKFNTGGLKHHFAVGVEYGFDHVTNTPYVVNTNAAMQTGTAVATNLPTYASTDCTPAYLGGTSIVGAPSNYNCTSLYDPDPNDPWNGSITHGVTTTNKANSWGVYGFDTIDITDQWILSLGLRWDDFLTHVYAPASATAVATDLKREDKFLSTQLGLTYKPIKSASLYINYSTAETPSGVTVGDGAENLAITNDSIKPEKSHNYEAGGKWDAIGGRLSLTGAVFRTDKTNLHVADAAGRTSPQDAIGKARAQGVELGATGMITPQWSVFGGYSYLDTKITKTSVYASTTDLGNRLPNTPKNSGSVWTTYDLTPKFKLGGGAFYVGKVYGNTANTKSVPDYWRFDAMASYQINDNLGLRVNVLNLTNKYYYDRVYSTHMAIVGQGRTALLTLTAKF